MDNRFINKNELRREGLKFHKTGSYCNAPPGSPGYYNYWDEQRRRCLEGYKVGNLEIPGYFYYYLNFTQIDIVEQNSQGKYHKVMGPPDFYDWDYEFFWAVEIARHGVTKEKYNSLQLDIDINDISGGNHLVVIKGRRKGYSYKAGSMLARNFTFRRNSKNFAMASEKEFLTKDGLLTKAFNNLSFMEQNTPFGHPKQLKDTEMHKKAGYKQKNDQGIKVEKGAKNEIIGITLKDDPQKARGKGGELGFFEEAGKFPGLLTAWEVCRPSYEQGDYTTGLMIAYGTGGTEDADYGGLEELFYNPDKYNVLPIKNQWDDGDQSLCSFFVPAYKHLEGSIDEYGNSRDEVAKRKLNKERDKKAESDNKQTLAQYIAEFPFTPREATLRSDNNIFPTAELNNHLSKIETESLDDILTSGYLVRNSDHVEFKPNNNAEPITHFPTRRNIDRSGCVVIKETPNRNDQGRIPNNLYLACHDPYAHDGSPDGSSLGATYIIKRHNSLNQSFANSIVAHYVGRPSTQDEYNRNLFMLLEYYNAKLAFENNRGNVMEYAKNKRKLSYLMEKPDIIEDKTRRRSRTTRYYGMAMTSKQQKYQAEQYIRDWLLEPYGKSPDGEHKLVLHTILDKALIQELTKYNHDGNFDRVSALMIGMFYLRQLERVPVRSKSQSKINDDFFKRDFYQ